MDKMAPVLKLAEVLLRCAKEQETSEEIKKAFEEKGL